MGLRIASDYMNARAQFRLYYC